MTTKPHPTAVMLARLIANLQKYPQNSSPYQAAELLAASKPARCHICDNSGDIHRADGEWISECPYCKPEPQAPQQGDTHHWPQQGDPVWTEPQAQAGEPEVQKRSCCSHASDCAVHNEPAYPSGPCDCGAEPQAQANDALQKLTRLTEEMGLYPWQEPQAQAGRSDCSCALTGNRPCVCVELPEPQAQAGEPVPMEHRHVIGPY